VSWHPGILDTSVSKEAILSVAVKNRGVRGIRRPLFAECRAQPPSHSIAGRGGDNCWCAYQRRGFAVFRCSPLLFSCYPTRLFGRNAMDIRALSEKIGRNRAVSAGLPFRFPAPWPNRGMFAALSAPFCCKAAANAAKRAAIPRAGDRTGRGSVRLQIRCKCSRRPIASQAEFERHPAWAQSAVTARNSGR
jgi:hypothetical protein